MSVKQVVMAAAGSLGGDKLYVEDVFSTYLYTGNSSTQTITNGIDLAGEGGMVWIKSRNYADIHALFDTNRGVNKLIRTNGTNAEATFANSLTSFNSNGFTLGANGSVNDTSSYTYDSCTFRKQPKFFDVVTWSGNNANPRVISHNLGSVPGSMFIKATSTTGDWFVYHRSFDGSLRLNTTAAGVGGQPWYRNDFTSTTISVTDTINATGVTYVAYLFAHDAGGFGDDGLQNVVSCGSYTGGGSTDVYVNLGYEPQWLLIKRSDSADDWNIVDNMRGLGAEGSETNYLEPNTSDAEVSSATAIGITATGFFTASYTGRFNAPGGTYIYIAIRRGPMKTPTSGTSVFAPLTYTGDGTDNRLISTGFPVDTVMGSRIRTSGSYHSVNSRIRGTNRLITQYANSEDFMPIKFDASSGYYVSETNYAGNSSGLEFMAHAFRRAPGFFDEVCYTGTDSSQTLNHNLGVAPEMIIVKRRNGGGSESWVVQHSGLTGGIGQGANSDYIVYLNSTNAEFDSDGTFNFSPTATTFSLQNNSNDQVNDLSGTYVAYLFATCAGVSKVGNYTGTGTTQQINCGFTAGARFVLIKRTDSTGDWYVWDSARGIVTGNDPYLLLNTIDAEVTSTDYIDPYSAGFEISSSAPAAINANGGSYIYLAIA